MHITIGNRHITEYLARKTSFMLQHKREGFTYVNQQLLVHEQRVSVLVPHGGLVRSDSEQVALSANFKKYTPFSSYRGRNGVSCRLHE